MGIFDLFSRWRATGGSEFARTEPQATGLDACSSKLQAGKSLGFGVNKRNSLTVSIEQCTARLTANDIRDWREAWQLAINVDNPNRQRLYEIYRDTVADSHLSGCIDQRRGMVMARSFRLVDEGGIPQPELLRFFDVQWFKDLMLHLLDAAYWGHSLVELGPVAGGGGDRRYSCVTLIPREHVVPEYGRVLRRVGDDWRRGIDYRLRRYSAHLIEAGGPYDLGLLLRATLHTIPKKNMGAFWDAFGEIFGMPMRLARTSSRDPKVIEELDRMLAAGNNQYMRTDESTDIQFIESTKADAFRVYDERIARCNSELSKLVIGQTMTIEDGSSLSQSQTHLEVFKNLVEADADRLRDIINSQLLPRMVADGFPVEGVRFEWDYSIDYTPEQQLAVEQTLLQHYDIDPDYFTEKYGIPCAAKVAPKPDKPQQLHNSPSPNPFFWAAPKNLTLDNSGEPDCTHSSVFSTGPSCYEGLHNRYAHLLREWDGAMKGNAPDMPRSAETHLTHLFGNMMRSLFTQKGAHLNIAILADNDVQQFTAAHTDILNRAMADIPLSDTMRTALEGSNYVFSGMKTFHELNEAFPRLIDDDGNKKTFERFLKDVQTIDETYNRHYLRAEYEFCHASALMAERWENFEADDDRYLLQYRTMSDAKVRPEHAKMHGITLPKSDSFWDVYMPPNGWNCRCEVVQVLASRYRAIDPDEARRRGAEAMKRDKKGMFRFNPGKQRTSFPDYNPYTIADCRSCTKKGEFAAKIAKNQLCAACQTVRKMAKDKTEQSLAELRHRTLAEMEPLLKIKVSKPTAAKSINVGFTKAGNKHLYSDTFGRSSVVKTDDLKSLDTLLAKAEYVDRAELGHPRTDGIVRFYYYKAELHEKWVRLNVAEKLWVQKNGRIDVSYFLYSVNDIKK